MAPRLGPFVFPTAAMALGVPAAPDAIGLAPTPLPLISETEPDVIGIFLFLIRLSASIESKTRTLVSDDSDIQRV